MKVNLFAMPTVPASLEERAALRPIGRNTERYQMMLEELRELTQICDQLGIDAFSTTEHHFHTEGGEALPNPLLLYSQLAANTKNLMFIPFSLVLPAADPLRVAEDVALFDNMYPGRVGVCLARGYQKRWVQILSQKTNTTGLVPGESDRQNREIWEEFTEIVFKAWQEDAIDFNGKHYQIPFPYDEGISDWPCVDWTRRFGADGEIDADGVIRKIGVIPAPYTKPHPPVFIPFSLSPASLEFAAKIGMIPMILEGRSEPFRGYCERYREVAAENGRDLELGEACGAVRSLVVADTHDEAIQWAMDSVGYEYFHYFNNFGTAELFRDPSDPADQPVQMKDTADCVDRMIRHGHIICGTPEEVKRQLEPLATCYGDGNLEWLAWSHYGQGTLPKEKSHRQVELFATKVMPAFK